MAGRWGNSQGVRRTIARAKKCGTLNLRRVSRAFDGDPAFTPKNAGSRSGDPAEV